MVNDMEVIEKECAKRAERHWVSVKLDKLLVPMCLVAFFFFAWIGG